MSEAPGAQLRRKIAEEREGLAGDLTELRRALRPLVAVAAAVWIAVLFLVFWRRHSTRSTRSTSSTSSNDVPRLKLAIFLVKLLWKLRSRTRQDRQDPVMPDSPLIVVVSQEPGMARKAPWPAPRPTPEKGPSTSLAEVPGA